MSYRAQVTDTPQQLAFGSQRENITLTNVGSNTVYLSNDSSITPGTDLVLDSGGSILVEPGTTIWGVCQSGLTSQVAVVSSVGERFAYASQAFKIIKTYTVTNLGPGFGTGSTSSGTVTFDNSFSTQYAAIGIFITANVAANVSLVWYTSQNNSALAGTSLPEYAMLRTGTNGAYPVGAIFPIRSFGGSYTIQPDALIGTSTITIIGYPMALHNYPVALNNPLNLSSSWNGASGAWTYFQSSFAVSTTSFLYLPSITGTGRVVLNYTQAGPGVLTVTPQIARTTNSTYWTATYLQYETAVSTNTVGAQLVAFKLTDVPPAPLRLQITSDASASLTNLYVSVDQNK
jgi:hypothetical protein